MLCRAASTHSSSLTLAQDYVYRQLEQDAFPRFLRAKAFGNLSPLSALIRLGLGLLALWAAFATALAMIFLDQPRSTRLWVRGKSRFGLTAQMIIPFTVAIVCILSHTYDLDPVLVFLGLSETVRATLQPT